MTDQPKALVPLSTSEYMRKPENISRFEELLGRDALPYVQSVLIAVSASPDLMACAPNSIMRAALRSASLGLSLDPALKQAWLVPYPRKVKATKDVAEHWIKEAQFQPHYKGLYTLAVRTGKYRIINVGPIYDGQQVLENPLTGLHVVVEENGLIAEPEVTNPAYSITNQYSGWRNVTKRRDQGKKVIGWMAYFETLRGTKKSVYMSLAEIDEHARAHVKGYEGNPNWNDAGKRPTMEMKTVFRQLMGWADLSGTENLKLAEALKADAGEIEQPADAAGEVVDAEAVTVSENEDIQLHAPAKTDFMIAAAMAAWNLSKKDTLAELTKLSPMTTGEFADWLASKS
jgi:recombination protein RecT